MTGFERAQPDRSLVPSGTELGAKRVFPRPRIVVRTAYRLFGDDATYPVINVGLGLYSQRVEPMSGRWVN